MRGRHQKKWQIITLLIFVDGSGNFLLSAFEYVVNFHIEYLRQNKLEESLQNGSLYQLPGTQSLFLSL